MLIFLIISFVFAIISLLIPRIFGYKRYEPEKTIPYECSIPPFGDARVQYDVQYYLFALLFVLFDVEVVLLFPWALIFKNFPNPTFILIEGIVFIIILMIGLAYAWRKGALSWKA